MTRAVFLQHRRDTIEAIERCNDHGDDSQQKSDQNLRPVAKTEDDNEQRIEGKNRNGVIRRKQRIENVTRRPVAMQNRARDDPEDVC